MPLFSHRQKSGFPTARLISFLVGATQAFEDLDKDGAGSIPNSKDSIMEGAQLCGLNPTDQEVEKHMESGLLIITIIPCVAWWYFR